MENLNVVTREELKKWMDEKKDFVLIDVMSQGSYEGKHLPGAKHAAASETDFTEKTAKLIPTKETIVVVYCGSFSCQLSPRAASKLSEEGYTNVYHFAGGLADWQDAGYSFEGEVMEKKVDAQCSCCG